MKLVCYPASLRWFFFDGHFFLVWPGKMRTRIEDSCAPFDSLRLNFVSVAVHSYESAKPSNDDKTAPGLSWRLNVVSDVVPWRLAPSQKKWKLVQLSLNLNQAGSVQTTFYLLRWEAGNGVSPIYNSRLEDILKQNIRQSFKPCEDILWAHYSTTILKLSQALCSGNRVKGRHYSEESWICKRTSKVAQDLWPKYTLTNAGYFFLNTGTCGRTFVITWG